jgi:hypothetical protein
MRVSNVSLSDLYCPFVPYNARDIAMRSAQLTPSCRHFNKHITQTKPNQFFKITKRHPLSDTPVSCVYGVHPRRRCDRRVAEHSRGTCSLGCEGSLARGSSLRWVHPPAVMLLSYVGACVWVRSVVASL